MKIRELASAARVKKSIILAGVLSLGLATPSTLRSATKNSTALTFSCSISNDLFNALNSHKYPRFDTPLAAIEHAKINLLILADDYPQQFTHLSKKEISLTQQKNLRLFIEFPKKLPGIEIGAVKTTEWERGVVASTNFGTALPALRILAIHDCHYLPVVAPNPWLVIARVAGFDSAIFGLPTNAAPILFEIPEKKMLVATTKLSGFITARFAPAKDWEIIWQKILATLDPKNAPHRLKWDEAVQPAFSADEKLPRSFERKAFEASAEWIFQSRLLVSQSNAGMNRS